MTTNALPELGIEVPMPDDLNLAAIDDLSVGQFAYLAAVVMTGFSQRMADPATAQEFAQYRRATGADWSGHEGMPPGADETTPVADQSATEPQHPTIGDDPVDSDGNPVIAPRALPSPPECRYDTVPFIAEMMRRIHHTQDASLTAFARQLQPMFGAQPEFFGSPEGIIAFKDSTAYCKEVLRLSGKTTKKIHERMPYVTWNPGQDPTMGVHQPKMVGLAKAFSEGTIPAENIDRIVWLDQDLTKYVQKTSALPEDKDTVLREFEPTLLEAAESSNPDVFNAARRRWANTIAHALDADGPPIAQTLRKKPDNVIKDQAYADGSGKIWIHATPDVFAEYKNFVVNQLNRNGAPIKHDEALSEWLYNPAADNQDKQDATNATEDPSDSTQMGDAPSANNPGTAGEGLFDDLEADHPLNTATMEDLTIDRSAESVIAEDDIGTAVTQEQMDAIESLSPGQLAGAILIGVMKAIFTMKPNELQVKKSHGAASSLMIIQDIETAYKTLGIGAIPKEAQRPQGPHGIVPTVLKRPNPEDPTLPVCHNPAHLLGFSPPPWTGYISEALNVGALHPKDAERLACDSQLVGQIWNDHHSVLNQRRAHRAFTPTQRRAILARDRGCQAPGCTIIAAYCQIHHIKPWELGGLTDLDNAITLCAHHHAAVHNEKWTIRTINGTHFFQPASWLDPDQPLLRNMYWAL